MTMRTDENQTRLYTTHPLRARRRPGPPGQDARPRAEQDLEDAAKVLEMIESGVLDKGRPMETPLGIPCDATGRPLRRLTAKDEQDLAFRIQTFGDVDARNTMVLANLGLVHLVANQMRRPHIRYDDLVQEGTLGLLRATETFEPDRGVRFSTYCVYWIRAKIQRYLQRLDRDDVPSIAGANMVEDADGRRKRPRARKLSMSMPVGDDGEDRTLGDLIKNTEEDPQQMTLKSEIDRTVERVLHEIAAELDDPRLVTIIERRLLADEPETLAMLGKRLSLSREGARLLENKVLKVAKERLKSLRD
jgi:RNA polymerase sigma factor (sigma-70 family)